ncbi:MAG: hypothetical protein ABI474_01570 [Actinomycetota bacterium]
MNRLRPRTTVLSGATIGLIAGAAIFGAVSSSASDKAPTASKPASVAAAPVSAASCATGQKLEKGVCIVHVQRTVVVPAPAAVWNGSPSVQSSGQPASGERASKSGDDAATGAEYEAEHEAEHAAELEAEHADDAAEHASDLAEHAAENHG